MKEEYIETAFWVSEVVALIAVDDDVNAGSLISWRFYVVVCLIM